VGTDEQFAPAQRFYSDGLGMDMDTSLSSTCFQFSSNANSMGLRLICDASVGPYKGEREDLYWKIGLGIADVDAASAALRDAGWTDGGNGSQFEDIGYVKHIADPQGFTIELLQTTFENAVAGFEKTHGSERRTQERSTFGVGSGLLGQTIPPVVGQVTLRVQDQQASIRFYEKLGMELISIQPVDKYGFTLYFLAPKQYMQLVDGRFENGAIAKPPVVSASGEGPDLYAVANREWVWQLPFTTLELQHRHGVSAAPRQADADAAGFVSLTIEVGQDVIDSLGSEIRDPDGTLVLLTPSGGLATA